MTEITVTSGAQVVINTAPWKSAKVLKAAIEREILSAPGLSIPVILLVDSSPAVDAALWPCLARCTYNGEKITDTTFDKSENRADYYEVVEACLKENFAPLADGLRLKLQEYGLIKAQATTDGTQKPASTTNTP